MRKYIYVLKYFNRLNLLYIHIYIYIYKYIYMVTHTISYETYTRSELKYYSLLRISGRRTALYAGQSQLLDLPDLLIQFQADQVQVMRGYTTHMR